MSSAAGPATPPETPDSPWVGAHASRPQALSTTIDGLTVHASLWEVAGQGTDVLLVHGGAAHREWWDHLAPLLRGARRVLAVDLSGHGASDRRDSYTVEQWADEVTRVAGVHLSARPLVIGHSMGGWIAHVAATRHPDAYAGVLAMDSPLFRGGANLERRAKLASRPVRSYVDRAEARSQFRTHPPTPQMPAEVRDHLTLHAFALVEDRWALRYDPKLYLRPQPTAETVQPAGVPTWWLHAEHGLVDEAMAVTIAARLGDLGRVVFAPGASHHMILDQPLASLWLLNAFVAAAGGEALR